jgi:hypothetical protein
MLTIDHLGGTGGARFNFRHGKNTQQQRCAIINPAERDGVSFATGKV